MREGEEAISKDIASSVLGSLLEGCQVISPDYRYLYVNEAVAAQGRTTRDRLLGRTMMEVYPGIETTEMFAALRRCMEGRAPEQMENEFTFPDGSTGWFELRFEPVAQGVTILSMDITERIRVGKALRASADSWRGTFDAITDIVCVISNDHEFVDINRAGCESVGLPREQIIGRKCYELVHAGRSPIKECPCTKAGQTQEPAVSEYEERGRSYELLAWPLLGAGSRMEGFVHVVKDITERKRTEANLVTYSERLARLAQLVQDISHSRSVEVIVDIVRQAARALVGSDGATFVLRDGEQCHYVDEDAITPLWKGQRFPMSACISGWTMFNKRPAVIEDIYSDDRIPHDAYRPTFVKSLVMVPIRSNSPIGAIGAYWATRHHATPEEVRILQALADSTSVAMENVRVMRELEEGKERTRAIYDHLPNPTFVWRREGDGFVLADFNEAARGITEGEVARFLARPPEELHHGIPDLVEDLRTCFDERAPIRREVVSEMPGAKAPLRLVLTYGYVPPDMVILHTEDVTGQRQTEEQLELSQRLEAVGRLAGGVAHDFNNMLSVIINYTGFAIEELHEADPIREDLEEVHKAGERAATLTRQLLAFSRKQILEPEVLSLNQVLEDFEGMLRRLLGEDIDIAIRLSEDAGNVLADPGQIEQVIMNLAINARDAMPKGGKLIIETAGVDLDEGYAEQHVSAKPGRFVMLSVSDTGCGMDAETRERIFEPFFTTKETGKGTGLGLSTVYGIVKQSGGNIWVYSEPGHGTTFKVYLPCVGVSVREPRREPASAEITGTETVLVVEDEEAVRRLAARILKTAGYQVLTAASGGEAMLICEKRREIDLLLSDVVMPHMSGRELALRLTGLCPKLKVLFMSGYTDDAIVNHGVLDSGTRFIGKPFSSAALARKVREVLDEEKVEGQTT